MIHPIPQRKATSDIENTIHQALLALPSTGLATSTDTSWYDFSPVTKGLLIGAS
jgi:hypothetical protein